MNLIRVFTIVVPVLAVVALGYLFRRRGKIGAEGVAALKSFVVNVTLPAVVFGAFWQASYGRANIVCAAVLFAVNLLGLGLGALLLRLFPARGALLPFLCTGFEVGMLGYSFYTLLFGEAALSNIAMLDVGHTLFIFTVYVGLLNARSGKPIRDTLRSVATSPVLIAIVLGLIVGATGLGTALAKTVPGELIAALLAFVSAPTACVILFVIGAQMELSGAAVKSAVPDVLLRLCVTAGMFALSYFAIGWFIPMTRELTFALLIMCALPAPFILPLYASGEQEQARVSTALSLNTLLSIAAFAGISLFV